MRLKSFYGSTMTEAMRQVREALGENAIIVATRDDEAGGVRVTAAIDDPAPQQESRPASLPQNLDDAPAAASPDAIETIATALLAQRVPASLAERLLATATQTASDDPLIALAAALDTHFTYRPLLLALSSDKPLVFVGPPGAGKTLLAGKLAAEATMAKRPVAVATMDTERAGGIEQLAAFTRLLKLRLIEIEDAPALSDLIELQPRGTALIVDTPGRNVFDPSAVVALKTLIKAGGGEALLVLPADLDAAEATDLMLAYKALGATRLLPTRLDTTRRLGSFLQAVFDARLPLAGLSASAKVTDAPGPLNPVVLARFLLTPPGQPRQVTEKDEARPTGTDD